METQKLIEIKEQIEQYKKDFETLEKNNEITKIQKNKFNMLYLFGMSKINRMLNTIKH